MKMAVAGPGMGRSGGVKLADGGWHLVMMTRGLLALWKASCCSPTSAFASPP